MVSPRRAMESWSCCIIVCCLFSGLDDEGVRDVFFEVGDLDFWGDILMGAVRVSAEDALGALGAVWVVGVGVVGVVGDVGDVGDVGVVGVVGDVGVVGVVGTDSAGRA